MIVIVKKNNIALVVLIFLLAVAVYSLNIGRGDAAATANGDSVQKVVIIDAGHGGEDPGAVSDTSGLKEKDVNLSIAFKVKELLEKDNYKVIMTREEDKLQYPEGTPGYTPKRKEDLLRRKKIMDESGANIVVSIHLNKFKDDPNQRGAQTFYPHNSPESQKLAISLQKAIKEVADPENKRAALVRGKPNELPIVILRDLKTTTAIVECGFVTNPEDDKRLGTDEYQNKMALAIKTGIVNYFTNK